jgi:hypothetical protein
VHAADAFGKAMLSDTSVPKMIAGLFHGVFRQTGTHLQGLLYVGIFSYGHEAIWFGDIAGSNFLQVTVNKLLQLLAQEQVGY